MEKTCDLALAYIGDGYLAAAMPLEEFNAGVEFGCDLRAEEDYEEAFAYGVPAFLAEQLCKQGCSDQEFADGYEAAQAVIPYLEESDDGTD